MTPPEKLSFKRFESLHRCTVCSQGQLVSLFSPDVSRCKECEVILRQTRPTQADVLAMQEEYLANSLNFSRSSEERQAEAERVRKNMRLVTSFMGPQQEAGRILLDVGTGRGDFLNAALEDGWLVVGSELSEKAAERIEKKRGLEMVSGQINEGCLAGRAFDAVTLWNSLDYLPNPGEVLRYIKKMLKRNGYLFLTVTNADATLLEHKLKKGAGNPLGDLEPGEKARLTHFQAKTLRNALKMNGFEIKELVGEGKTSGQWWTAPLKGALKLGAGVDMHPQLHCVAVVDQNPDRRAEDFE